MRAKRSRGGTSARLGETELIQYVSLPIGKLGPAPPPAPAPAQPTLPGVRPPKCARLSLEERSSGVQRTTILSMPLPDNREVYGGGNQRIGNFLEQCYYCKSKICEDKEVFMYSDLKAFCTDACREAQIWLDNFKENHMVKRKLAQ